MSWSAPKIWRPECALGARDSSSQQDRTKQNQRTCRVGAEIIDSCNLYAINNPSYVNSEKWRESGTHQCFLRQAFVFTRTLSIGSCEGKLQIVCSTTVGRHHASLVLFREADCLFERR